MKAENLEDVRITALIDAKLQDEIEEGSPLSDLIDDRVRDELQRHEIEIGKMIEAQMELVLQGEWFVEACAEHLEKLIAPAAEMALDDAWIGRKLQDEIEYGEARDIIKKIFLELLEQRKGRL